MVRDEARDKTIEWLVWMCRLSVTYSKCNIGSFLAQHADMFCSLVSLFFHSQTFIIRSLELQRRLDANQCRGKIPDSCKRMEVYISYWHTGANNWQISIMFSITGEALKWRLSIICMSCSVDLNQQSYFWVRKQQQIGRALELINAEQQQLGGIKKNMANLSSTLNDTASQIERWTER